ncbi:hypothetical protein Trydic_g12756 [Trypoxylus dichotomus]
MGLRTASVRHPHVEVMAPALTEPNQAANFKLSPDTQSASPINGIDDNISYVPHEDSSCVKGGTEQLKLPISNGKELNDVLDHLNTLVLVTEIKKENGLLGKAAEASESTPLDNINSSFIMNNSSISMDDQEDKMGLQKSGLDNVLNLLKDKPASEMEQMFHNLQPFPDLAGAGDIGQNVDEIMQVITSMEGGSNERLNNANNDIGGESENIFPLALFNEMDVMSMSMEEPLIEGSISKETQTKDLIADVQKRQVKLERKVEFLLRRLRKIQIRVMGQHFSGEVAGVFEHVHRTLRRLKDGVTSHTEVSDASASASLAMPQLQQQSEIIIPPEKMKPISSSSAKNLVRKLETSSILQSNTASRRHNTRYFGSGSIEASPFRSGVSGMISLPQWTSEHKQDFQRVAGLLHTEVGLVQQEVDSEATASSSGGESCDEMQNYNNSQQQHLSIQKRAAWKYATDRAAIAARWTWLQAQISDLEYRIRQHSELYKQIRSSKGAVKLGDESPPHSVPTSPVLNGYRGQLPGASPSSTKTVESPINGSVNTTCTEYQCARTRPLINFRKRKLLQTTGLHAVSKKAARPSTVRCGCIKPNVPCALCTGRTDPTHPRDPMEYLSKSERISLLDSCFHPVFSLLEDCPASIHLDAIMKTPEWQQRSSRSTIKSMKYITKSDRLDKMSVPMDHRSKKLDQRRKYPRLLKSTSVNAISAKIKGKIRGRKSSRHHSQIARLNKKRHSTSRMAAQAQAALYAGCEDEELENLGTSGPSGKFDSPSTSPLLATQSISGYQRRNRVDSYDIDNIVIPYSVAASTRVEKLQYKEILTPKWREVEYFDMSKHEVKNNGAVKNTSQDGDIEDISDDAVITRHDKCEHDEKKKFLSYLKLPLGYGRSRSHKRTDSRAESSGANTPDPTSPHAGDQNESLCSPLTSPPATPLSITTDDNSNLSLNNPHRRRTVSQSRHCKEKEREVKEELRCTTPEHVDILPYDKRVFPLSEDTYLKMKKNMPENHLFAANVKMQDAFDDTIGSNIDDKVEFHDSESTESAYGDEDPNDPEWIEMERVKDRSKR